MEADAKGINKIVLSGAKSQRVAFTSMPAIYLGKGKPNFDTSMNDAKVWQQDESKPDRLRRNLDTVTDLRRRSWMAARSIVCYLFSS